MKRKIMTSMFLTVLISVISVSLLILALLYQRSYHDMKTQVRVTTEEVALSLNETDDLNGSLSHIYASSRLTLVDQDGNVVFDNVEDPSRMENHSERTEIVKAFKNGKGESFRLSTTFSKQFYYYSILLNNGMVLRGSNSMDSIMATFIYCLPFIVLIGVATMLITAFVAARQTRLIVKPINSLDLEVPLENEVYVELTPLLRRMEEQGSIIREQMGKLRQQQEEFSTVITHMQEGLIVLNKKMLVLWINPAAANIFGVEENYIKQKHLLSLSRDLQIKLLVEKALQAESGKIILNNEENEYQVFANPVLVGSHVKGAVLLFRDVTNERETEAMRREFSANVSHELKTPLTSIAGYAEIMKNGLVQPQDMKEFSSRIYEEAQIMINLVGDIIRISRLDEAEPESSKEQIALLSLIKQVIDRLQWMADQSGIQLFCHGEEAFTLGREQILQEMVYNLVENAIKYNREGGSVWITLKKEESEAILTVRDNGIGIDKDELERVFERFYRVDKSHSKETGGTGLGLSIVKHGAIYHHAKLSMDSEPGEGTTVTIRLRLV